jgi:hypothetical protein
MGKRQKLHYLKNNSTPPLRFPLPFTRSNHEEWSKGYPILGVDLY